MGWLDSALNDPVGLIMTGVGVFTLQPSLIMAGMAHMNAANDAAKAKNAAKDAANNSATARTQQIQSATAVARLGWGRSRMSGPIAYAQSTGSKSEFLHHVTPLCIGPIDAIESVMINDTVLPAENVTTGMVESGDYYMPGVTQARGRRVGSGTITAVGAVTRILSAVYHTNVSSPDSDSRSNQAKACTATFSGTTITVTGAPAPNTVDVRYEYNSGRGLIRVKKSLGPTSNTAYADLVTESGGKWTAAHKLNGVASIYIRQEWQSDYFAQVGMGSWSAIGRWRKVLDPRENRILWSNTPTNAAWTKSGCTAAASSTVASDGVTPMTLITTTNTTNPFCQIAFAATTGTTYTATLEIKAVNKSVAVLELYCNGVGLATFVSCQVISGPGYISRESASMQISGLSTTLSTTVALTVVSTGTSMPLTFKPQDTTVAVGDAYLIAFACLSQTAYPLPGTTVTTTATRLPVTAWSSNPALCIADYMTTASTSGGLGVALADVNLYDLARSADICDQMVQIDAAGTLQKRYELHGDVTTDMTPADIMRAMCDTMGGQVPIWTQGKWSILAAAYSQPCAVITEDMIIGESIEVMPAVSRSSLINRVSIKYTEPGKNYAIVEAPQASSPTYLASDGGIDLPVEMQVNLCQSQHQANRLAWIKLNRARMGFTVQMTCNMYAYNIGMGRTVAVTSSTMGWSAKEFEVIGRTFNPLKLTVTYTLKATAASIHTWSYTGMTAIDLTPSTTLPNPLAQPAALSSLAAVSGTDQLVRLGDGTFVTRALVTWAQPTESLVVSGGHIDVEWTQPNRDAWQQLPQTPGAITSAYIGPLSDTGVIIIRARSVNSAGRAGPWTTIEHTVVGQTQLPADVAGLASTPIMGGVRLSWTASTDIDYRRTELRVGAAWASAALITKGDGASSWDWQQMTAGTYTVWAAHVDQTGNYSAAPASISVPIGTASLVASQNVAAGAVSDVTSGTYSGTTLTVVAGQISHASTLFTVSKADAASALEVQLFTALSYFCIPPGTTFPAGNYQMAANVWIDIKNSGGTSVAQSSGGLSLAEIRSLAGPTGFGQTYRVPMSIGCTIPQSSPAGVYTVTINASGAISDRFGGTSFPGVLSATLASTAFTRELKR